MIHHRRLCRHHTSMHCRCGLIEVCNPSVAVHDVLHTCRGLDLRAVELIWLWKLCMLISKGVRLLRSLLCTVGGVVLVLMLLVLVVHHGM